MSSEPKSQNWKRRREHYTAISCLGERATWHPAHEQASGWSDPTFARWRIKYRGVWARGFEIDSGYSVWTFYFPANPG